MKAASGAPVTSEWSQGLQVKGSTLPTGTAIATFDPDGTYGNHTDGRSHAAIYAGQDAAGLQVWDQWLGQPVHQRTIFFNVLLNPAHIDSKNLTITNVLEYPFDLRLKR